MVNVNVATTAFYAAGNLAKAMLEFKQHTFNARVDSFVKGLRVMVSHLGHRKTVKRIATLRHEDGRSYHPTARTYRFRWDDENREVTIEQYFKISTFFSFFVGVILLYDCTDRRSQLNRIQNQSKPTRYTSHRYQSAQLAASNPPASRVMRDRTRADVQGQTVR